MHSYMVWVNLLITYIELINLQQMLAAADRMQFSCSTADKSEKTKVIPLKCQISLSDLMLEMSMSSRLPWNKL